MTGCIVVVKHHFRLFDPASWLSWLIRTIDKCTYNHCAMLFQYKDQLMVVEARGAGIFASTFNNWLAHRPHKTYSIGVLKSNYAMPVGMDVRIMSKLGVAYDKEALFIWHPYRILSGKWLGGTSSSGNMVCSEYIAYCYKELFKDWYKISTGDIVRANLFNFGVNQQ